MNKINTQLMEALEKARKEDLSIYYKASELESTIKSLETRMLDKTYLAHIRRAKKEIKSAMLSLFWTQEYIKEAKFRINKLS